MTKRRFNKRDSLAWLVWQPLYKMRVVKDRKKQKNKRMAREKVKIDE